MWAIDSRHTKLKSAKVSRAVNRKTSAAENTQTALLRKTAQDIIDSGVIGQGEFVVSLAGHANENFESSAGHQNDYVMISIQKLPKEAE